MQHYERTGELAKAEDELFAMLDAELDNNIIKGFGLAFFFRRFMLKSPNKVFDARALVSELCSSYKKPNHMDQDMSTAMSGSKNVLNADYEIKGNVKFAGELTFDGKLDGEIQTDGLLSLGDGAVVSGNINAQSVIVRGKINGNINAKEKIEIKSKAELFGDIRASKLVVEEGVTFVGKTEVNPNKVAPTPPVAR